METVPVETLGGSEAGEFKRLEVWPETLEGVHETGLFWKVLCMPYCFQKAWLLCLLLIVGWESDLHLESWFCSY